MLQEGRLAKGCHSDRIVTLANHSAKDIGYMSYIPPRILERIEQENASLVIYVEVQP